MQVRVSFSGRNYDQNTGLPSVIHLDEGATLSRAADAIQRQADPDSVLSPNALIAVNGNHAGTLAAPDHRELREGDEISVIATSYGG